MLVNGAPVDHCWPMVECGMIIKWQDFVSHPHPPDERSDIFK